MEGAPRPTALVLVLAAVATHAEARAAPPATVSARADLALKADRYGGAVWEPSGHAADRYRGLAAQTATEWFVLEDRVNGTVRFAMPEVPVALEGNEPQSTAGIEGAILDFLEATKEYFGIDPERLGSLEVVPFGGGWLFIAEAEHEGIPVRGSSLQVRLDSQGRISWVRARMPGALPPMDPPIYTEEEAKALAAEAGYGGELKALLQVGFPGEGGVPRAVWSVTGTTPEGYGGELLLDAVTGKVLASLDTRLFFEFEVTGTVTGRSPDPEDVFAMPHEYRPDESHPLKALLVSVEPLGLQGFLLETIRDLAKTETDAAGAYQIAVSAGVGPETLDGLRVDAKLEFPTFAVETASPSETNPSLLQAGLPYLTTPQTADFLFNERSLEYEAFHVHVAQHGQRATTRVNRIRDLFGAPRLRDLAFNPGPAGDGTKVIIQAERDGFGYWFDPVLGTIRLANDERMLQNPVNARFRKIVPTVIYHEYAHYVLFLMRLGVRATEVHEGVADALASYVARTNYLGFTRFGAVDAPDGHPELDFVRNLEEDTQLWPADVRRAVSGALWELWRETLPGGERLPETLFEQSLGNLPESTTAFELLLRWLESRRGVRRHVAALGLEVHPFTGYEFLAERRHLSAAALQAWDERQVDRIVADAFARRNLLLRPFQRGDANGSGAVDLADAVTIFAHLFQGREVGCPDALDTDDSGELDISDGIYLLRWLFQGGPEPAPPSGGCGWDLPREESGGFDNLACWDSPCPLVPWWKDEG